MIYLILNYLRDLLRPQHDLLLENLALRQQILVLERQVKRPRFMDRERTFWVILNRYWPGWKNPLRLVKPQTVVTWHRQSWRLFLRWKSKPKDHGRPNVPFEVIKLIRQMSLDNPLWGAPRIHGELVKLGYDISETTVAKYMVKRKGRPMIQAFPFESAPKYLIRDRDGIYGKNVQMTIDALGMKEKVTSARSPWQNGYCERVVGTIKRECLNHMIILSEGHAHRVLKEYFEYYHDDRTHLGLEKETPASRAVERPELGLVKRRAVVGGLHSRYFRDAA